MAVPDRSCLGSESTRGAGVCEELLYIYIYYYPCEGSGEGSVRDVMLAERRCWLIIRPEKTLWYQYQGCDFG